MKHLFYIGIAALLLASCGKQKFEKGEQLSQTSIVEQDTSNQQGAWLNTAGEGFKLNNDGTFTVVKGNYKGDTWEENYTMDTLYFRDKNGAVTQFFTVKTSGEGETASMSYVDQQGNEYNQQK